MTQVDLPPSLIKELINTMERDPAIKAMFLESRTAYVKEAIKMYISVNGQPIRKVIREELTEIKDEIKTSKNDLQSMILKYVEGIESVRSSVSSP